MTSRERFLATMLGGAPDRIPFLFGGPRQSTFEAWYQQGLSRDTDFWKLVGPDEHQGLPLNLGPLPAFEPVVIEETKRHKIWIDELGAKRIDHKYLPTPGFVTRKWLEFPVKNRADFREMLRRYDPATPERLPADWEERKAKYRGRSFILSATIPSMFWRVRDWVGFENLCVMFHDDPALVHEMMEYVADFNIEVLRRALDGLDLDFLFFNEDMAYKTASMISPAMVREFMWPRYRKLVRFLRDQGVSLLVMDCDGHIGELIPLWLEVGIDTVSPVEIAAHNDPVAYRKQYGKRLGMFGGIDKRELRFDKARVKREVMSKVPWLVEQGRYIPQVDHGVPPDVPLRNFLYMCALIKEIAADGDLSRFEPDCSYEDQLGPIEAMWTPDQADAREDE